MVNMGDFRRKKGQVTIFIIIAVVIIGIAILLYFLTSGADTTTPTGFDEENPTRFIQSCLEDEIQDTVELLSLQGGLVTPEFYTLYEGNSVEYVCYTSEYYLGCIVQRPMLISQIRDEIKNEIQEEANACFRQLVENYEDKNYHVQFEAGAMKVELLPKRIVTSFDSVLTVDKGGAERHDSFNVVLNNNLYELVSITNSIIDWESTYGDADTYLYMSYYPDLKVEKKYTSDSSEIYILTDRNNGNKFQFAVRSGVLPAGYGSGGIAQ